MGSLTYGANSSIILVAAVFLLVCGWLLCQHRKLALLQLGAFQAQLMGLDLRQTQRKLVWAVCFISGMCVALAGVIGFIGLVVPHLLRLIGRDGPAFNLPASHAGRWLAVTRSPDILSGNSGLIGRITGRCCNGNNRSASLHVVIGTSSCYR